MYVEVLDIHPLTRGGDDEMGSGGEVPMALARV
jgi:hypothetical protein